MTKSEMRELLCGEDYKRFTERIIRSNLQELYHDMDEICQAYGHLSVNEDFVYKAHSLICTLDGCCIAFKIGDGYEWLSRWGYSLSQYELITVLKEFVYVADNDTIVSVAENLPNEERKGEQSEPNLQEMEMLDDE